MDNIQPYTCKPITVFTTDFNEEGVHTSNQVYNILDHSSNKKCSCKFIPALLNGRWLLPIYDSIEIVTIKNTKEITLHKYAMKTTQGPQRATYLLA